MKKFFEGFQYLMEEFAFAPLNALRTLELESWFGANILNWGFMLVGMAAFVYWMKQLKGFNDNNEERKYVVSHSFLAEDKQ
ncbi:DUF6341 family protein [Aquimarina agarivorans]|uniref:DUF6341 family protein n=1 Tax=Aquimarina agarivorans TaxID=980584 RepID=UPI000248F2A9|nr:hypothetical protein [Aquimarina agarivorans]